ncbi:Outer membrane porin F [Sulfitobacter sp. DSM 110093]|uniref:OmpA family protein n=1 Tax=Sulfitobacter sp. DSM 110093 TaxID=2883127 RepID=UPI001FAB9E3B|nr:OmpA family protein [Sulfitobacter sp. DSM 110093]UOA32473.1 Outer membrane porin F [Sulfitobacter sp. DSM 110093]
MGPTISNALRAMAGLTMAAVLTVASTSADAQTRSQQGRDKGVYTPTIWVDPDGCEHWVMDDGAEGYMTPHTTRQGIPVCRRGDVCGVMEADQFFATDKYNISAQGRARLANFFQSTGAVSYIITGHTDSRASDAYNMRLSYNRANSVAHVANQVGARIADVRGYGERMPAVPNNSAANMAKNRRVEIICIR